MSQKGGGGTRRSHVSLEGHVMGQWVASDLEVRGLRCQSLAPTQGQAEAVELGSRCNSGPRVGENSAGGVKLGPQRGQA